ncbi:ABC transporter ATP-binding protein [Rhodoblastus sp. 17X3]|uniref:ABC transporter ATP-binding protein n=1 Tax=Rhodoblastus sp. 17X3 TaxID=3047026 RepID=UPI0024B6FE10|nr:ABC transporter ATP-binding protein [Rhodoblastus sp. 17X3]MDI9849962.1 ABC transporter ATP-binding protein [Rhodoblastus sp. 17X3]
MDNVLSVENLTKTYATGFAALKGVDLSIRRGEIFALLGPNGAGKTTLIGIVCGLVRASGGKVTVDGFDIAVDYRSARKKIGLVPQELATNMFETVWNTTVFSRGLFGKKANPAYVEKVLRDLSLWDKKDANIRALSGGMKRRVLIAKALAHEPEILFLDEPTAGVDVELRRDMWEMVRKLRESGVTIILTTHYIEEAEDMADRIGVIDKGEIILVEEKHALMRRLGQTRVCVSLTQKLDAIPEGLFDLPLTLSPDGKSLSFTQMGESAGHDGSKDASLARLLKNLIAQGVDFASVQSSQSSLEDIFIDLVGKSR